MTESVAATSSAFDAGFFIASVNDVAMWETESLAVENAFAAHYGVEGF